MPQVSILRGWWLNCACLSVQEDSPSDGEGDTKLALLCLRLCLPVSFCLAGATGVRWLAGWPPFAGAASSSLAARRGDTQRLDQNWIELDQLDQKFFFLSIWMFHEKINFKFLKMSKNRNFESKTDSTESTGSNWIKLDQKLDQTGSSFLI